MDEISQQVSHAAGIAGRAVEQAQRTGEIVNGLSVQATQIGDVLGLISGIAAGYVTETVASEPLTEWRKSVNRANNGCPTLWALAPIARQKPGMVLTFVDLGPRLITVTPHSAITGPYHRNAQQIIDVMHAWRGDAAEAHRIAERYHVDYVLICPNLSESTIYQAETPNGFYGQLVHGHVPSWLAPIGLPADSPYRMWRMVPEATPAPGAAPSPAAKPAAAPTPARTPPTTPVVR